jgi:large subunit ribosomal protein L7/L12
MAFDVKLEGFDAAAKLKIIKELRTFTNLGRVSARSSLAAAAATKGFGDVFDFLCPSSV